MVSKKDYQPTFAEVTESDYQKIVESRKRLNSNDKFDVRKMSGLVFNYLIEQTRVARNESKDEFEIGNQFVKLETRLRTDNVPLWLVAVESSPPKIVARTDTNQTVDYFVTLVTSLEERQKIVGNQSNEQHLKLLKRSGLRAKVSQSKNADYKQLPSDLQKVNDSYYNSTSLQSFNENVTVKLLETHAKQMSKNKHTDCLNGTEVQVIRTSVSVGKWDATRSALVKQIDNFEALARRPILGCLIEEVVPVGFHVLGKTNSPIYLGREDDDIVLFDLYTLQLKRYFLQVGEADKRLLIAAEDDENLQMLVAKLAKTIVDDVRHVTCSNWKSYVSIGDLNSLTDASAICERNEA